MQSGICSEFGVFVLVYFVFVLVYLCICVYVLGICMLFYLCIYLREEEVGGVKPGICSEFGRRIIFGEGWEKLIKEHQA